jgi:hypothetical protein
MNHAQQAVDEMLPMITEFLKLLGMSSNGEVDFENALEPFSEWVSSQEVTQDNFAYLVSGVAAFFCHYYVQKSGAHIEAINNTVQLTLPLGEEISQSIDPYFFAAAVANKQMTLIQAIEANVS